MKSIARLAGALVAVAILSAGSAYAQNSELAVPDVTITTPASPATMPPYLRDPAKAGARNQTSGRDRVEEDKFVERPCGATRISTSIPGGKCLLGYRIGGALGPGAGTIGGNPCAFGLDVVEYTANNLAVEADIISFDPYKVTALGPVRCAITPYRDYAAEEFQDMNQVTRRGANFHNFAVGADPERSIEFSDSDHPCIAMRRLSPPWNGGYIWVMHVSICRTDAKPVSAQEIADTTGALQIHIYEPSANLRPPPGQ